ncbi:hypothetical protein EMIT0194MI4_100115 [Pseudomonas sp. IT-194MI4]
MHGHIPLLMKDLCIFLGHSGITGEALFRGGKSGGRKRYCLGFEISVFLRFRQFSDNCLYDRFDLSGARYWN